MGEVILSGFLTVTVGVACRGSGGGGGGDGGGEGRGGYFLIMSVRLQTNIQHLSSDEH